MALELDQGGSFRYLERPQESERVSFSEGDA